MGLAGLFASAISAGFDIAQAREVIKEGLQQALSTMEDMVGNPGQQSVFNSYVVPQFTENAQAPIDDGWEDVDIGEYMDFMGEIVGEGNQIMAEAYALAQEILSEYEEAAEEAAFEE